MAFSSRIVTLPWSRVSTIRLPSTSSMSSKPRSRSSGRDRGLRRQERLQRLVVGLQGRDGDQLPLGVAQRGQAAAEDAAGVDVDRRLTHAASGTGVCP